MWEIQTALHIRSIHPHSLSYFYIYTQTHTYKHIITIPNSFLCKTLFAHLMRTLFTTTITPIFFSSSPSSLRSSFSVTFNNHRHFLPSSSYPNSTSITTMSAPSSMSVVSDTQAGIATRLWLKFRKESIIALYTPFLVSLASGNLRLDTFRQYIAQDIHFLKAFAQAYKLAEDYADDDDDKNAISQLRKSVLEELKLHDSFVKEWGADLAKENTLNSATVKFTDFLLATASGKIEGVKGPGKLATPFEKTIVAAYTLGAMTPCMRLYAFIGKELQSLLDTSESNHPYIKWIQNYSSPNFEAVAVKTEDLLDKLSVSLTGEELGVIEKLYHQAMKLEIDFFSAQPLVQKTVVPLSKVHNPDAQRLVIFLDFDLTCTVVDSSAILAEIAILTAPKYDQNHTENQPVRMPSADNQSISTGEIVKEVESPIDKIQAFNNILQKENEENKNKNITVYIGDSVGDLLCLLEADVGIVLGSSLSLRRLGTHFGVSFVPLFPGVIKKQKECSEEAISSSCNWMGLSGVVYTVSSWAEIHAFILGP